MPTTTPWTRARLAGVVAALSLVLPAGCSNDDSSKAAAETTPVARDLAGYDAYVLGSAENNPSLADIYAIRFNPFTIDRITTDKRVSSLGADPKHLIAAAADENIDQLAQVTGAGEILPIPGLGRPFAYSPRIIDDVLYYDDAQGEEAKGEDRTFAWDLNKRTKTLVFQSKDQLSGATPVSGGRLLLGRRDPEGKYEAIIRSRAGKLTRFPIVEDIYAGDLGGNLLALNLVAEGDRFGDKPIGILLLDLDTGKKERIPGVQFIAWNPEGTRLLARRTDVLTDSKLVILDPRDPGTLQDLATVPGLAIYGGSWVRGDVPS